MKKQIRWLCYCKCARALKVRYLYYHTVKPLIQVTPNPRTQMILISSCFCLCPVHWNQMLSREWCSWSSADRRCSNYIWMINNLVAYLGVTYIRDLTIYFTRQFYCLDGPKQLKCAQDIDTCEQKNVLVNTLKPLFVLKHVTFLAATMQL